MLKHYFVIALGGFLAKNFSFIHIFGLLMKSRASVAHWQKPANTKPVLALSTSSDRFVFQGGLAQCARAETLCVDQHRRLGVGIACSC